MEMGECKNPVHRKPILDRSLKKDPNGNPGTYPRKGTAARVQDVHSQEDPRGISFYSLFLQFLEKKQSRNKMIWCTIYAQFQT